MKKVSFAVPSKASVSLASVVGRRAHHLPASAAARSAGVAASPQRELREADPVPVLVETDDAAALQQELADAPDEMRRLTDGFVAFRASAPTIARLLHTPRARRVQTKKRKVSHLGGARRDVRLSRSSTVSREVAEDGAGVLIGVVDTGFDLSHPAFRDPQGRLRVEALLDQIGPDREFTTAALERRWAAGTGPGADEDGHGTHVASIAGGSAFAGREGVAPGARFLLVRTDMVNTDEAVAWILRKAGARPCVVNMSIGHHFGAHDGTDAEERLHRALVRPGHVIVVSAGNERDEALHIGKRFRAGQTLEAPFELVRQEDEPPSTTVTLWHDARDTFDVSLVTTTGQEHQVPSRRRTDSYSSSTLDIELSRRPYRWSGLTQLQIAVSYRSRTVHWRRLRGWKLRVTCRAAQVGRLDGWFENAGCAVFLDGPLLDEGRTIGLPATGDGCIAVGSHVTATRWRGDAGPASDTEITRGRMSPFSSLGPTRDGRQKPDVSAPGQYIAAALAANSELAGDTERATAATRVGVLEGTSMASPVVAGIVALLLQRRPNLTTDAVRQLLRETSRHDRHTGRAAWHAAYGFGKIDVAAALARL
jgi:subtilisin family serine protease